ncbi:hypothetical protein [Alloprevotella sp. Lung230]|uniref:hypothetical protein n=1 Tax=Alloprevotella sp. Lung230 TaxID=2766595 RepID=UPI001654DAB6|nr:hypothetical protein [Alloprevotella sp. Lung230]MBC8625305.1 hypothetical protein [Alloprevotella sp. Lung230]
MKINLINYVLMGLTLLTMSCSRSSEEYVEEDYEKLFPFPGIEKPKVSYEDQIVQLGDPDAPVSDYVYPGVEITENVREYKVTLTCSFNEVDILGQLVGKDDISSRYTVRYITPDKQLRVISSNIHEETANVFLTNSKEQTITFTAKSGYPMYLCVNGVGPRGSSIKATISAISEDGFTIVKPLSVNEHQNEEGIDKIKAPFCGYIILP